MALNLLHFLEHTAYRMRVSCIKATTHAGSGHVTSCLSAADVVAVVFFYAMSFDPDNFGNPANDRFILSKGHAAPLLYAVWSQLGKISDDELLTLRQFDSTLEGHPTPRFYFNEAATGSLGQGLSIGLGMALAMRSDGHKARVYVLLGDGELAEGSNWEAIELARFYKTENLIAVIDVNRLGQSDETMDGHNVDAYRLRFQAFGWHAIVCNGHDVTDLMRAFDEAHAVVGKPVVIIAFTYKGYGLDGSIEDAQGFHGKAISHDQEAEYLHKLQERFSQAAGYTGAFIWKPRIPKEICFARTEDVHIMSLPDYAHQGKLATRKAYGQGLKAAGIADARVVVLDAEVKNSTYADIFEQKFPERFFQCFIAEQNMVGMAVGMTLRGKIPYVSTFASFLSRATDQLRMAAIGRVPLRVCGSHAGVSIGQDGPSQMGLEDIAVMRALPDSIVLYPSDAVAAYKCVELMLRYEGGISYLRTTRGDSPIIYQNNEKFEIGGCKQIRWSSQDMVCVVGAGATVFEALKAYEMLRLEGVLIRVVDCYSVKPLPVDELRTLLPHCQHRLLVIEDHYPQGGLGEAIASALAGIPFRFAHLAVNKVPRSGKPDELLAYEEIDAQAIVKAVKHML